MLHHSRSHHIVIGTYGPRHLRIPVRLGVAELTTHLGVTGATGTGKSRWLAHLAVSLIMQGEAVTVLDPHGDTARLILATLIAYGVYDDPAAFDRITGLNLPAAARLGRYPPLNILDQPSAAPTTGRLVLEALRRALGRFNPPRVGVGGLVPVLERNIHEALDIIGAIGGVLTEAGAQGHFFGIGNYTVLASLWYERWFSSSDSSRWCPASK